MTVLEEEQLVCLLEIMEGELAILPCTLDIRKNLSFKS